MTRPTRVQALQALVAAEPPMQQTLETVRSFSWDSEELVELTAAHATHVLQSYLAEQLHAEELVAWAEALEGRDDVALEERNEEVLKRFLFEASSPELAEPISASMAQQWVERLSDPTRGFGQ